MSSSPEKDKSERFLRKAERQACWAERDKFWACMKSNAEDVSKCREQRKGFEELCPSTWVVHFDRKFQYEKFKAELEKDGLQKTDSKYQQKQS